MIKRTLEISQQAAHLSVRRRQLVVTPRSEEQAGERTFPCEDLGLVCVDNLKTTYTHQALVELMENGAVLVACGRNHLPAGLLLPFSDHAEVVQKLHAQISQTKPGKKRLWQQIVQAKIRAQAKNMEWGRAKDHLLNVVRRVRSGDPSNMEAQAARYYWSNFFGEQQPAKRRPSADDPFNAMLNYGYAILRAAVARALVSAGAHPALGIHHSNRSNAWCLADDLLEPLRPLADAKVRDLIREEQEKLTPEVKAELLSLLSVTVKTADTTGPLLVALHRFVGSFSRCLENHKARLEIPVAVA